VLPTRGGAKDSSTSSEADEQPASCNSATTAPRELLQLDDRASCAPLDFPTTYVTSASSPTGSRPRFQATGAALLVAMVALIAVATLTPGSPERLEPTDLTCLVCGSAGGADVIRNILLFLPLGVATALLGWRWPRALATGILLSLFVESMQYFVVVGRDPSLSDLLTNSTGTALGYLLAVSAPWWILPTPTAARRILVAGTVVWAAFLGLTAVGLQWDAPPLPYQMTELPPRFAGVREYEGVVHERNFDGAPPTDADAGAAVAAAIQSGNFHLGAVVGPMYPPGLLRPLVAFYRPDWSNALLFGQQRRNLVLSVRTRAERARLQGPGWVLHDVFPDLAESGTAEVQAQRITLAATVDGSTVELSASRGGQLYTATLHRRLSLGWTFILPAFALLYRMGALLGALWLAAPLLPLGYWTRRAVAEGAGWREHVIVAARVGATVSAVLLIVSAAGGLAAPSTLEWAALVAAALLGWALGALTTRPS